MTVRLTETAIARNIREVAEAKARRDVSDAAEPGLRLRLAPGSAKSPNGHATWVLACRDSFARMRRFPLGEYPTLSIAAARKAAAALRHRVRQEKADPIAEARRQRAIGADAAGGQGTLTWLLDLYGRAKTDKAPANPGAALKSWPEGRKRLDLVFKSLLKQPLASITLADLQMIVDAYPAAQSAAFAVRTMRPPLRWAAAPGRGYVSADLGNLRPPVAPGRRKRVLARDELAAVLPVLKASARPHAAAMRFMLLTLARREEAAAAKWSDVDFTAKTWTIRETKNGEPHVVPLSRQALDLLRARLPVGDDGAAKEPPKDALVFATGKGAAPGNWHRETKALHKFSGTGGWSRHDLRRTGATMLGDMGEIPDIIEAALNHVSIRSALAATYNRSRYRPKVAEALQRLADALEGIEAGGAEVVPLRAPA